MASSSKRIAIAGRGRRLDEVGEVAGCRWRIDLDRAGAPAATVAGTWTIRAGNDESSAHHQHQREGAEDVGAILVQRIGSVDGSAQTSAGAIVVGRRLRTAHGAATGSSAAAWPSWPPCAPC